MTYYGSFQGKICSSIPYQNPSILIYHGKLEVVQEVKLVGVIVDKTLSWQKNTDYICRIATQKLLTIRRLKKLCLDTFAL